MRAATIVRELEKRRDAVGRERDKLRELEDEASALREA